MSIDRLVRDNEMGKADEVPDIGDKGLYAGSKIDSQEEALAPDVPAEPTTMVADIQGAIYSLGMWRVKPGQEDAFITAWKALGDVYRLLSQPPAGKAILVQSGSEPSLFYHFDPWVTLADIEAMQQDTQVQAALEALNSHCTESKADVYRTVAETNVAS